MDPSGADTNILILPGSKQERRQRLRDSTSEDAQVTPARPKKRMLRKVEQLQRKRALESRREESLRDLKALRLAPGSVPTWDILRLVPEIACQLQPTVLQRRKHPRQVLQKERRRQRESPEENDSESDSDCSGQDALLPSHPGTEQHEASPLNVETPAPLPLLEEHRSCETSSTAALSCRRHDDSSSDENDVFKKERDSNDHDDDHLLAKGVPVQRLVAMERQRLALPAVAMEQEIVDLVLKYDVTIVTGDTGCGKSTQVPQFLYEAGLCGTEGSLIGITQPRRVAVLALSQRVAEELNDPDVVGYQVRYDKSVTARCRLKFMTDGILLREIQNDFLCKHYAVIVLDEAHERSVNCDILLGLLARVVLARRRAFNAGEVTRPLRHVASVVCRFACVRLVIMSATLRITDFTENPLLFKTPPPVINIPARTHPVSIHFSKRTSQGKGVHLAASKAVEIHKKLPPGSILVFTTGRREVEQLCYEIRRRLTRRDTLLEREDETEDDDGNDQNDAESIDMTNDSDGEESIDCLSPHCGDDDADEFQVSLTDTPPVCCNADVNMDEVSFRLKDEEDVLGQDNPVEGDETGNISSTTSRDIATELGFDSGTTMGTVNPKQQVTYRWLGSSALSGATAVRIVPLYARLPIKRQHQAFTNPEPHERVIIVATNVAETSVTLPNVRYVVDGGREKQKRFLSGDTASVFMTQWISKASADQRAGRAGRVGPGHCYRLYSSAMYTHVFPSYPPIRLFQSPIDGVLLFMASLGIPNLEKFPFPTPPKADSVRVARHLLVNLGALRHSSKDGTQITPLGRLMSQLPVAPRFAAVLVAAVARSRVNSKERHAGLVGACCCVVAGVSVGGVYEDNVIAIAPKTDAAAIGGEQGASSCWQHFDSDLTALLWGLQKFMRADDPEAFCQEHHINQRQASEATALYQQLMHTLASKFPSSVDDASKLPSKVSSELCFLLGLVDHIALRCDLAPLCSSRTPNAYVWSDFMPQRAAGRDPLLFVHKSSCVAKLRPRPALLAFSTIMTTVDDTADVCVSKRFLRLCFPVDSTTLASVDSPLVVYSDFLKTPRPTYVSQSDRVAGFVTPRYVPLDFSLPTVLRPLPATHPMRYRVFARAFLEGRVFTSLETLFKAGHLHCNPSTLVADETWVDSEKQSPLRAFVETLRENICASREELVSVWKKNPTFLLSQYEALLSLTCPRSVRKSLKSSWPPA